VDGEVASTSSESARQSAFRGVTWKKGKNKWYAQIRADGKKRCLGYFDDDESAARAYDRCAIEHGLLDRLNFNANNRNHTSASVPVALVVLTPTGATTSPQTAASARRRAAAAAKRQAAGAAALTIVVTPDEQAVLNARQVAHEEEEAAAGWTGARWTACCEVDGCVSSACQLGLVNIRVGW
jgi:hypothetical protein